MAIKVFVKSDCRFLVFNSNLKKGQTTLLNNTFFVSGLLEFGRKKVSVGMELRDSVIRIVLHVVGIIVPSIVLDHVRHTFLIDYSMILPLTHIF